jgi:hypothetical protein
MERKDWAEFGLLAVAALPGALLIWATAKAAYNRLWPPTVNGNGTVVQDYSGRLSRRYDIASDPRFPPTGGTSQYLGDVYGQVTQAMAARRR